MAIENDTNFYNVNVKYKSGREYNGRVGYSKETMRRHRKAKVDRDSSKKFVATVVIVGSLALYGAVDLGINIANGINNGLDHIATSIQQYQDSKKPYAYTNMSSEEFNSLDFASKVQLYQNYFDFVRSTAPAVNTQQTYDCDVIIGKVSYMLEEYSNNRVPLDAKTQDYVISQFKEAVDILKQVYNGQYMITSTDPDVKIAHDKSELFQKVAKSR